MHKFEQIISLIITYFLMLLVMPPFLIIIILLLLLPESKRFDSKPLFYCLDLFYKCILKILLVPIHVEGKENIPDVPAIIIANHQSILDVPLVGMLLNGYPQMWFSLTEYAKKPLLGFFLQRLGVPLDRSDVGTAAYGLLRAIRLVKNHQRHTILFPEGGRYNDGTIHEFLKGFVLIAKVTARPVVPVFLVNPGKVLPPHSFLIHHYPLKVIVGPHFIFNSEETDDDFVRRVYNWFLQQALVNQ